MTTTALRKHRIWAPDRIASAAGRVRLPFNAANLAAGLTAGLWYAFGAIPLQLEAGAKLGLPPAVAASAFFIFWFTGAVSGILLSLRYKQPLAITWTIPGLIFLAGAGTRYTFSELVGASIVAGLLIVILGLLRVGERLRRWIPLPVVVGTFAGGVLHYASGIFDLLKSQPLLGGSAIAGYLLARKVARSWLPPVAGTAGAGLLAALLAGAASGGRPATLAGAAPTLTLVSPAFNPGSFLAVSLPLVVFGLVIGNVQGIGLLVSKGYRPPADLMNVVVGLNSIVNALFGGHPSTVARNGVAIVAGEEAGPAEKRYAANLVASIVALGIACSATTATGLLGLVPAALVATLAGLALLSALTNALHKTVVSDQPLSGLLALAMAGSGIGWLGIGSAFWALVGGLLVALLVEGSPLRKVQMPAKSG
jgi:benzoate membrane transport protein